MKNQTSFVSGEEERFDQLYRKQQKGIGEEVQWNDQHKRNKNIILDMQANNFTK